MRYIFWINTCNKFLRFRFKREVTEVIQTFYIDVSQIILSWGEIALASKLIVNVEVTIFNCKDLLRKLDEAKFNFDWVFYCMRYIRLVEKVFSFENA